MAQFGTEEFWDLVEQVEGLPPQHYKSWSLLLISNFVWLLPKNEGQLRDLKEQFEAFGTALGPEHLAVWFWKSRPGKKVGALAKFVGTRTSAEFCRQLGLKPSQGPYIFVTTSNPETIWRGEGMTNHLVVHLKGLNASQISALLCQLADQIVNEKLDQVAIDSELFWLRWKLVLEKAVRGAASFLRHAKITFKTEYFEVEILGNQINE